MAIAKKQFEFTITGRSTATDVTGILEEANLTTVIDEIIINGVEIKISTLTTAANVTTLANTAELVIVDYKNLS
jgi:hypothetical protein